MEDNLFTTTAFSEFKSVDLNMKERAVTVYHASVEIYGKKFDAVDLIETVESVIADDNIVVTNREMIDVLKNLGVLEYEGNSRWCSRAEAGINAVEFLDILKKKFNDLEHSNLITNSC